MPSHSMPSHSTHSHTVRVEEHGITELRLPNGLVALLYPRRGAPLVAVQTWYRVGSREEEKGRTGLAHFLEHLMFKGTDQLRKGDIDLVTLRNGGHSNADTSTDRTRYYFTFAADRWERALEIEADRMRGSAFNEHEFALERGPVLEELRRDHDDPWWRLHEALEAAAYQVHPYHNPVIGWAEEITKVPREDVLAFYDRWYQPGNCTLVIVGDIDVDRAAARIDELFGHLPGAPIPEVPVPQEPPQEGERRFELELEVKVPRMMAAFVSVRARDPEDTILDVLQVVLATGKSSRLYERLVRRDRLAVEVNAWNDARRDPGLFTVAMEIQEGVSPAAAEAVLWEEFDRLGRDGPTPEELTRAKTMLLAGLVYRRATVAGLADLVGSLQVIAGDWRQYLDLERRVEAVTAAQIAEAARRFLRRSNRTVGWAVPRPADALPRPDLPGDEVHDMEDDEDGAARGRPEPEILRRPPGGQLHVSLPARRVVLANGLTLILLERRELPVLSVRVFTDASQLRETVPGVGALVGECLDEGAASRTGQEISTLIESLGATLSTGSTGAALRCLKRDASTCLDVLADVLLRPDFAEAVLDRKRGELNSAVLAEDDDPAFTGRLRLRAEIYGEHPMSRRDKGGVEALRALTREHVLAHHRALFVPRNTIVAAVGDFDEGEMERELTARFGDWEDRAPIIPKLPEPRLADEPREMHIDQDRDQLHIYFGHLGIRRANPDYHALLLADHVLGSGPGFTDRLSKRLRDEMGLAYTVWARIARGSDLEPGTFTAYIGTSPAQRAQATAAMRAEIERFVAGPLTAQELDDARRYLLGSYVFGFETTDVTAEQLIQMERLSLGFDYPATFVREIQALTVDQVQSAVGRHLFPDRLIAVSIGRLAG